MLVLRADIVVIILIVASVDAVPTVHATSIDLYVAGNTHSHGNWMRTGIWTF